MACLEVARVAALEGGERLRGIELGAQVKVVRIEVIVVDEQLDEVVVGLRVSDRLNRLVPPGLVGGMRTLEDDARRHVVLSSSASFHLSGEGEMRASVSRAFRKNASSSSGDVVADSSTIISFMMRLSIRVRHLAAALVIWCE